MYRADSDILTIVLTLLTFAAGIYSSVKKKRREDGNIVELEDSNGRWDWNDAEENFAESDPIDSLDSIEYSDDTPVDTPVDIAEQDVVSESDAAADKEKACNGGQSLKERIKNSPKDMVLFAEIMNPKHKEF